LIGIDTNVLIRWNLDDRFDPDQAKAVRESLDGLTDLIYINPVVLAESIWVIGNVYRVDRQNQARFLHSLLSHPRIVLGERSVVQSAVAGFEQGGPGFADHLIGALNEDAGCRTTLTFDKTAAKSALFTALG
jgi:predicted nucleic-acid-binding protein